MHFFQLKRRQTSLSLSYVMMAQPLSPTHIFTYTAQSFSHFRRASWLATPWLRGSHSTRQWLLPAGSCLELADWNSRTRLPCLCYPRDRRDSWPNHLSMNPLHLSWVSCTFSLKGKQDTWSYWLWPNVSCVVHMFQPCRMRTRSAHSWVHGPQGTCGWASGSSQAFINSQRLTIIK